MPIPSFQAVHTNSSSFATTLTGSFNVGANPATILAFALAEGGLSAVRVNSIVIGGQTMDAYTDRSMQTEYGAAGRCRGFGLIASSLTGTQSYTLSCTNLSGTPDGNAKPAVIFVVYRDGATATSASRSGQAVTAGNTFSSTIASSATARAIFVGFRGPAAVTATSPTVKDADQSMGSYTGLALSEDGATSSTLDAVTTSTEVYIGQLWSVEGASGGGGSIVGPGHLDSPLLTGRLLRGLAR